jgi:hypothetical protein
MYCLIAVMSLGLPSRSQATVPVIVQAVCSESKVLGDGKVRSKMRVVPSRFTDEALVGLEYVITYIDPLTVTITFGSGTYFWLDTLAPGECAYWIMHRNVITNACTPCEHINDAMKYVPNPEVICHPLREKIAPGDRSQFTIAETEQYVEVANYSIKRPSTPFETRLQSDNMKMKALVEWHNGKVGKTVPR